MYIIHISCLDPSFIVCMVDIRMSVKADTGSGGFLRLFAELGHLSPIMLAGGSFFMSAVTVNYPLFIFSMSVVEASIFYLALRYFSNFSITPEYGVITSTEAEKMREECKSYFSVLTPSRFKSIMENGVKRAFPNYPIYYLVFGTVYCIQSMIFFSKECSELGTTYSNRPYTAIIGGILFISLYFIYFLAYGCDSFFNILATTILAGLVAYLICNQNAVLFGKESVALLFIPSLTQRKGMDYICVTTKTD